MCSQVLMLMLQQQQACITSSMAGLPRLVQSHLLVATCGHQRAVYIPLGGPAHGLHTATPSGSSGSSDSRNTDAGVSSGGNGGRQRALSRRQQQQYNKRLHAYKSRLPRARKYGPVLRERDPQAFEQMRLVVGYYDLPQNLRKERPAPPSTITINNMQTLLYTHDVDPYYKLALLSYRSKLQNMELVKGLAKTRSFLGQLSAQPDFVPAHLDELTAAAWKQQQQQQAQTQTQCDEGSSSGGNSEGSSADAGTPAAS